MKEKSVVSLHKIIVLLLTLNNVHGNSRQWYNQPRRNYFNYGSLDDQSSTFHDNDTRTAPRIAWGWPFNQQNTVKVVRHPPSSSKGNEDDMLPNDTFIFPDVEVVKNRRPKPPKFKIGEAPACEGSTFCEEAPNYPTNFLNNAIKSRNLDNYESVDAMDIAFRIGADLTESLCVSTEQIVYPKTAETVNKQWLFIVNHPNFTQGVRVETCTNAGEQCNIISGFAEGYATTCEQKYIYRQLAAISELGSISHELFRFPASCCCHVQFLGTSLRFRADRSIDSQKTRNDVNTIAA